MNQFPNQLLTKLMQRRMLIGLCCAVLSALPGQSSALTSDKEKPISVEADSVDINQQTGISQYKGNVELIQGSMHLTGALLHVYTKDGHLDKAIIEGKLAKFTQQQDNGNEVRAQAQRIEYFDSSEKIYLYDDATVWQAKDSFHSDHIIYDMKKELVTAGEAATDGKPADTKERVKITIQPKQK